MWTWLRSKVYADGEAPDPSAAHHPDPDVARLRRFLLECRWEELAAGVREFADPRDRGPVIEGLASWSGRPRFFDALVTERPKSSLAYLLRGAQGVVWAWEARTGALAKDVQEDAWPIFFQRLKQARRDLERAAKIDAQDVVPFGPLLRAARGLQLQRETARKYFDAARRRFPDDLSAHRHMLIFLCEKWGGSHDAMFAFARQTCGAAPRGSLLHSLIVTAHYERWLFASSFEDDRALAAAYWRDAQVRNEIEEAHRRSLGAPEFRETKSAPAVREEFENVFAWLAAAR